MKYNKVFIFVVLSILAVQLLTQENWAAFDAGSSGTRLFYYQVENNGSSILLCEQKCDSKLADILGGEDTKIQSFVNSVKTELVNNCQQDTGQKDANNEKIFKKITLKDVSRILLFSTAGSRDVINSLPQDSKYAQALNKLKVELSKVENNVPLVVPVISGFKEENAQVSVVSGRQEGIYGFFALYLALDEQKNLEIICGKGKDKDTCWKETIYYEVGGSSTQIAFVYKDKNTQETKTKAHRLARRLKGIIELPSTLSQSATEIYSRSFLGNGGNQLAAADVDKNANCVKPFPFKDDTDEGKAAKKKAEKNNKDNANVEKVIKEGETRFDDCLKLIEQNAIYDKTLFRDEKKNPVKNTKGGLQGEEYDKQYKNIIEEIENADKQLTQKKSILFFNSGGAFFSTLPPKGKKFIDYKDVNEYVSKNKHLCYREPEEEVQQNACLALTLPLYFAKKLKLQDKNLRFVLNALSWTQGAVFFAKNTNKNYAEAFVAQGTNEYENQKIKQEYYGRRIMRHQQKKHFKTKKHHLK